jgi:RepB DNA-primase from phage plasmid
MLDAFASVGADRFDLTLTDAAGDKVAFHPGRTLDQLRRALPGLLKAAGERQHNVIVRPRGSGPALVQLDDLGEDAASRLRPVSFLVIRTSPGSHQAWLAISDADPAFVRRLRKGSGADLGASGASRISGSLNFKEKYAPAFPRVETVHAAPGRVVTREQLEALGMVAPAEPPPVSRPARVSPAPSPRTWPSYQRCVDGAPQAREGGRRDISRADFTFALIALDWGFDIEETAARLLEESPKARAEGERYARRTAQAAAAALERRQGPQR